MTNLSPNCGDLRGPLYIPVRNVTLGNDAIQRGIALSVGTPPQQLAFQPEVNRNNTILQDVNQPCTGQTPGFCFTSRGGLFDEHKSSTWSTSADANLAKMADESAGFNLSSLLPGTDTLEVLPGLNLTGFPLPASKQDSDSQLLGLGKFSTILNTLSGAGKIATHNWAYWHGLVGSEQATQMDGSFVLGGYDAAKTSGANYTDRIKTTSRCSSGMILTATRIQMRFPNGTEHPLLTANGTLAMCIQPAFPRITVPQSIFLDFRNYSGGHFLGRSIVMRGYGETFSVDDMYPGDITFTFSSGLSTTIPNSQLVLPPYRIDNQGHTSFNGSQRDFMIAGLEAPNQNDFPILGQTFLTQAYLFVNRDDSTFTLWNSNATADQNLIASPQPACRNVSVPGPTPLSSSTSPSKTSSLTGSAIAGITIGIILALALLALLIFFLLRRRTKRRRHPTSPKDTHQELDTSQLTDKKSDHTNRSPPALQELPATHNGAAQELPTAYEIHELDSGHHT